MALQPGLNYLRWACNSKLQGHVDAGYRFMVISVLVLAEGYCISGCFKPSKPGWAPMLSM